MTPRFYPISYIDENIKIVPVKPFPLGEIKNFIAYVILHICM